MTAQTPHQMVLKDLEEQRKIGVPIDERVLQYVRDHSAEIDEYYENSMAIEEIADHVVKMVSMGLL